MQIVNQVSSEERPILACTAPTDAAAAAVQGVYMHPPGLVSSSMAALQKAIPYGTGSAAAQQQHEHLLVPLT